MGRTEAKQLRADDPLVDELADVLLNELMADATNVDEVVDFLSSLREDPTALKDLIKWKAPPVNPRQFFTDPFYVGPSAGAIFPVVLSTIEEICSGKYVEAVLTGGIGCSKTTIAIYVNLYFLYLLSMLRNPQKEYNLFQQDEIIFVFQSVNAATAKQVDYARFRGLVESSPYFMENFPFDSSIESEMRFPSNIYVTPASSSSTAIIGRNVLGGIIDEVNFFAVTEKSKLADDGGTFDQAQELYNAIVRRRESRFQKFGHVPGMLCLVASARYPGQFTDRRKEAAERQLAMEGRTTIYIYDKRQWEVKDPTDEENWPYCGRWFRLFLGDLTRKPRILEDDEEVSERDEALVMDIPVEHLQAFYDNLYDAIRDIAGVATLSTHPFIPYPERVDECFGVRDSVFSRDECDFQDTSLIIYPKRFIDTKYPRYVHVDLSTTGDSTGVAIGYVSGFTKVKRAEGETEILPIIEYDALLEVRPPRGGEIHYARIRGVIYKLQSLGLPIKWVSLDGYNSTDFIQTVRQKGFKSGLVSMDKSPAPYEVLKQALMDGRVKAPAHAKCQIELVTLERNPKNGKIDHPEHGSKDVSDAMAGVAYGLSIRREIWAKFGIRPSMIPKAIQGAATEHKGEVEESIAKR